MPEACIIKFRDRKNEPAVHLSENSFPNFQYRLMVFTYYTICIIQEIAILSQIVKVAYGFIYYAGFCIIKKHEIYYCEH